MTNTPAHAVPHWTEQSWNPGRFSSTRSSSVGSSDETGASADCPSAAVARLTVGSDPVGPHRDPGDPGDRRGHTDSNPAHHRTGPQSATIHASEPIRHAGGRSPITGLKPPPTSNCCPSVQRRLPSGLNTRNGLNRAVVPGYHNVARRCSPLERSHTQPDDSSPTILALSMTAAGTPPDGSYAGSRNTPGSVAATVVIGAAFAVVDVVGAELDVVDVLDVDDELDVMAVVDDVTSAPILVAGLLPQLAATMPATTTKTTRRITGPSPTSASARSFRCCHRRRA
jgi:hypothetical protein